MSPVGFEPTLET